VVSKVLSVNRLRRLYGGTAAVDNVSFDVGAGRNRRPPGPERSREDDHHQHDPGGPRPTSGTIRIEDADIATDRARALERTTSRPCMLPFPAT